MSADDADPFGDALNPRRPLAPDMPGSTAITMIDAAVAFLAYFMVQVAVELVSFCVLPHVIEFPEGQALGPCVVATDIDVLLVMQTVAMVAGAVVILSWLRLRKRLGRALWGAGPHGMRALGFGLATGILGAGATYLVNALLALVFQPEAPVQQSVVEAARLGGRTLVIAALVIVIIAPIVEEFLFRGVLFSALRRRVGLWPAAVVSSVLFVAVHVEVVISQPLALVGMFLLSMILAWAFHRSGSLVVSMVAHSVFNAISLGLALSIGRIEELLESWEAMTAVAQLRIAHFVATVGVFGAG